MKTKTSRIGNIFAWVVFLLVVLLVTRGFWGIRQNAKARPAALPIFGEIRNFELIERSGKRVSATDLQGKIWIADFIFTHCAGPCPLMSNQMSRLQKDLQAEPNIRFVSFSVDPGRDTPEVLSQYARRYDADPNKWLFLTGEKSLIYELSEQHFHLGVGEIPETEREALDQVVRHSTKFVLVDQAGRIRGYYTSENAGMLSQLIQDSQALARA